MRLLTKPPAWFWVGLVSSCGAQALVADTSANPYLGIASSNVFRLKQPQPVGVDRPPAPLPRVKVVGITTMLGDKLALLKVYLPAVPPEPAREISCILAAGQREGPVEVLEIDETAGSVKVSNSGTVLVVALDKAEPDLHNPARTRHLPPLPMHSASRQ